MIEDAVKIVKNHYAMGEILNADKLYGVFVNLTLSSQREQEVTSIYRELASLTIGAIIPVPFILRQGPHVLKRAYQTTSYIVPAGWMMKPAAMASEDLLGTILHPTGHC